MSLDGGRDFSPGMRRTLAWAALTLGIAAAFAGDPVRQAPATDRLTALELAAWIRDRHPGLRVIDARPADKFNAYQVPTAEHFTVATLDQLAPAPNETLVVYAGDAAAATAVWSRLRSRGHSNVYVFEGGISAWIDDVMNPVASTGLTRYFGGTARASNSRRRGC